MQLTRLMIPQSKWGIKCPYEMDWEDIGAHNTANKASAMAEASYMVGNNKEISFHYVVDDYRIVQCIEDNRNAWSFGDGNGRGNRKTLAIEICYSTAENGELFSKSERLAAKFIAFKLKQKGKSIEHVKKHQDFSGKYCPHKTLDLGWERFLNMIREELGTEVKQEETQATKYKVGDTVNINGVYKSSNDTNRLNPAKKQGAITKIIAGARNPYLLDNGNIGWVNDNCIVSNNNSITSQNSANTANMKTISNCKALNLRTSAQYGNNIYKAVSVGTRVELMGEERGWAKIKYEGRTLFCGKNYLK